MRFIRLCSTFLWVALLGASAPLALADQQCARLLLSGDPNLQRSALIAHVQKKGIPAYLYQTENGEVPVVLINSATLPRMQEIMDHSMGTIVQLQPAHTNDHGMLRLTDRIIDVDTPGKRGFGELHNTGLAWKQLPSYLALRAKKPSHILFEVVYSLTPEELRVAEYYQRVRRAGIVRVPFSTANVSGATENCYKFCKGIVLDSQLAEYNQHLHRLGVLDVEAFYHHPSTREFLRRVHARLISANPYDGAVFNANLVAQEIGLIRHLFINPNAAFIPEVGNWLVTLDSSILYRDLLTKLEITDDLGSRDMNGRRATAMFIYDSESQEARFWSATYDAKAAGVPNGQAFGLKVQPPWQLDVQLQRPLGR